MRHALDMFRDFVSSGNINVFKILKIGGGYHVPFHEFAKSAILGSRKYYRSSVSHVVNVFKPSGARRASHLTALRILARLSRADALRTLEFQVKSAYAQVAEADAINNIFDGINSKGDIN